MKILDCGHEPSPHSTHTTGTGHTPEGKEICWSCCNEGERTALKLSDKYLAYLSGNGLLIITWPGGKLGDVTYLRESWHNIGGKLLHLRMTDVHGQKWFGTSPSKGSYCKLRKIKR